MNHTCIRPYRVGLDLGTNSIGWFVVWLGGDGRPNGLGPGGVRVFPDGRDAQSGTSNAADRRRARGARRRRDRFIHRRQRLMDALIRHGLMPASEPGRKALEALDPYALRARALDVALPAHHVGRALFHINQRRGFLSNRRTHRDCDAIRSNRPPASTLKAAMGEQGARTLGEFLWWRHRRRETVRARGVTDERSAMCDLFATRDLLSAEFDAIWNAQAAYHPAMTPDVRERIADIVFFQRPFRQPVVGKCALSPASRPPDQDSDGYRCPWAHPLAQRFRILQAVRNLEIRAPGQAERKLTGAEADAVVGALLRVKTVGFDRIRSLLRLPAQTRFNLETEHCAALDGDATAACLAERSRFGRAWRRLPPDRQIAVVDKLVGDDGETALIDWLMAGFALDRASAEQIAAAPLPDGHCRLGLRAIRAVLPHMEAGLGFHEAAARAGYDPAPLSDRAPSPRRRLPYYGKWLCDSVVGSGDPRDAPEKRYGRFANPTVHIGLGQLRRVVNGLIARHGPPSEIVVEFARALKHSTRRKAEIRRTQQQHRVRNDARRDALARLGLPIHARNLPKMRLWEELNPDDPNDRRCLYSGEAIDLPTLMSAQVDIDHLVPFSASLDDSAANKTVCMRYANRHKGCRTPFAAFAMSPTIDGRPYRWDDIVARAARLPAGKHWRFDADAGEKFAAAGGYIARQLNETGWLARVAKRYLEAVCDRHRIWVVPGRLTATIRAAWRLDSLLSTAEVGAERTAVKNRADHRHHAIDALVAALTDRSLLQAMAAARDDERDDVIVDPPWPSLRDDLAGALRRMVVSHKADHGRGGKLHLDTAYGLIADPDREGANLVYRKPVESLSETEIARIRDVALRDMVRAHVAAERANGVGSAGALRKLGNRTGDAQIKHGLRRVRLLRTGKLDYLVPIRDRRDGRIYKAYAAGENFCVDIFATPDGDWDGEAVRRFDANRQHRPRWRAASPGAVLVMRLHKADAVRVEHDGQTRIMVVHRLEAAHGRLKLAAHNETGRLDHRHDSDSDPFRWLVATYARLKTLNAEPVRVDALGRVFRLRPPAAERPDDAVSPPATATWSRRKSPPHTVGQRTKIRPC